MPRAADFRTIRCQASLFTPQLQFRAGKVLAFLLREFGSQLDADPVAAPAPEGVPPEVAQLFREFPQVTLKSEDGKLHLQASAARLDVIREEDPISDSALADFFTWATEVGIAYLGTTQAKAGRVACILRRIVPDQDPARSLSRHFCQERWIQTALNRPGDFQLHAHKRFRLDELFDVNSWMRCLAAGLVRPNQPPPTRNDLIQVEQDFNSLAEQMETRELNIGEITQFFEIAPREMRHVLELYFPDD